MPVQIRIYTIREGQLQQFAKEWMEKVYPLRLEQGYRIDGAWLIEKKNQFVWLLIHDGPGSWPAKEEAYYTSADREAMDPNPARLILRPEEYFVENVL